MAEIYSQFIDGQNVESQGTLSTFRSPWDGASLAEWKNAEEMEVIRALQAAKKFLARPAGWALQERMDLLQKMASVLEKNAEAWAEQEALYQGLPKDFVLENGVLAGLTLIERNLEALKNPPSGMILSPSGVVAVLTPWSLSLRVALETLIPALAAGNAVIVKVSSRSPGTSWILQEFLRWSEVPAGAVAVLLGEGSRAGNFLASHPGVRAVSFVGSPGNFESVLKAAAPQVKKLRLRGGTKNVALVLPGMDYDQHFEKLMESFITGAGRLGWGMSRLLTTESEFPQLIEKIQNYLQSSSSFSRVTEENRFGEIKEKAISEHGKLMTGTDPSSPAFLIDLPNCSDLQQEELQVPVFPIVTVKYQHELAKWANNSPYGSLAVLWGDPEKARKVAEKLEFSHLWFNHWMRRQDLSPWGFKQSAFGISEDLATGPFFSDQKLTV